MNKVEIKISRLTCYSYSAFLEYLFFTNPQSLFLVWLMGFEYLHLIGMWTDGYLVMRNHSNGFGSSSQLEFNSRKCGRKLKLQVWGSMIVSWGFIKSWSVIVWYKSAFIGHVNKKTITTSDFTRVLRLSCGMKYLHFVKFAISLHFWYE